ncbi:DUF2243 domain-containing protein [Microbacterium stercoris]|uniref:DUF2243 domain-containing protein n=1 Tax=Microbacterium stercoris TaxID=2820289 RepID=A0A939QHT1_9MICO|nr:DUF2243 domain-containing protein [Microbacterium stercoris]MBO3662919.1 DUF2243 domain-containing protein [Microbacterium stercoris]
MSPRDSTPPRPGQTPADERPRDPRAERSAQNLWSGVLFGVGLVAFLDEAVFHQLLHWHHFYDRATPEWGLISDGLFHAFSWFATIAGLFLLADLRRRGALWWRRWVGGVLVGAGAFQLYDGTVHHKWFRIHQIRYVEDILPYDLVWNVSAVLILAAGIVLAVMTRPAGVARAKERT